MKKKNLLLGTLLIFSILTLSINAQVGRLKTTTYGHTLIGYQTDWWGLSFGNSTTTSPYGDWNIQLYGQSYPKSLNFWKPGGSFNSGDFKFAISSYGHVGIGREPNPWVQKTTGSWPWQSQVQNFKLQVGGNAIADAWFTWSDSTIKENMTSIPSTALASLMKLEPLMYNYKSEVDLGCKNLDSSSTSDSAIEDKVTNPNPKMDTGTHFGFTAQAISRVFPNLVRGIGTIEAVNYIELVPVLVKGVQEQQKTIDTLKKINDSLNLQIQQLRQEIVNWKGSTIDTTQDKTRLFQNNPNPFEGNTTISYYIDENTTVTNAVIEIRNIMGNLQSILTLGDQSGIGQIQFNGSSLNQGYYIYTLKINGSVKDSKMFLKEN
ncbi:MAG: tail fiber domain-containing protein [Flavobacterium sp.]